MKKQTQTKTQENLSISPESKTLPHQDYYTDEWLEWTQAIRSLNDAFRLTFTSTELYCSPDILKLSVDDQASILERVRQYRNFNAINDPLMSHNQGFLTHEGTSEKIVWMIYYHEEENETQSKRNKLFNPVNIDLTKRHMMIMTASEWWQNLPENIF